MEIPLSKLAWIFLLNKLFEKEESREVNELIKELRILHHVT